jgi:hypothetical protein
MSCAFRFCFDVYFFLLPRAIDHLYAKCLDKETHFRHRLDSCLWMNLPAWKALLAMEGWLMNTFSESQNTTSKKLRGSMRPLKIRER